MSPVGIILIVILLIFVCGGGYGWRSGWYSGAASSGLYGAYGGLGLVGSILLILLALYLLGVLR